MKKIFIIFTLTLSTVILATIITLLNSTTLQTKIANSITPQLAVGKVDISLSSIHLHDINFDNSTSVKEVSLDYDCWALFSKNVELSNVKINQAKIKIQQSTNETAKDETVKAPQEFKGIDIQLPWTLSVSDLQADISVDDKQFNILADTIYVEKNLLPQSANIKVDTTNANIVAQLKTNDSKERILKAIVEINKQKVLQTSLIATSKYESFVVESNVDVESKLLKEIVPSSIIIPEFDAKIYAKADIKNALKNISLNITGKSNITELANVSAQLAPLGDCKLNFELNVDQNDEAISVQKFDITLFEENSAIISANINPFVATTKEQLEQAQLNATIAIPSRILNAFAPEIDFQSDNICTKISAHKIGDTIKVQTTSPLSLTNVNISKNNEPILKDFNMFANLSADIAKEINANIKIDVKDSPTSNLSISSNIKYKNEIADVSLEIDGELNPIITRVHSISTFSSQDLKILAKSSMRYTNDNFKLISADLILKDNKDANIANFDLKTEVNYAISTKDLEFSNKELLSIYTKSFPFALVKPFVPQLDIENTAFNFDIYETQKGLFEIDGNLMFKSIFYKDNDKYLLRNLSTLLKFKSTLQNNKLTLDILDGQIGEGENSYATFTTSAIADVKEKSIQSATLKLSAILPQLFNQPILQKFSNLSKGSADVDLSFENNKVNAEIKANSIVVKSSQNTIETIKASIDTDFKDINISTTINSTSGETIAKANAQLSDELAKLIVDSQSIVLDDIIVLSTAFKNPNYDESVGETAKSEKKFNTPDTLDAQRAANLDVLKKSAQRADSIAIKDTKAFWFFDKKIDVSAKIAKIVKDDKTVVENINFALNADESNLNLTELNFDLFGSKFDAKSTITFDKNREIPYQLLPTTANLTGFKVEKLFENKEQIPMTGMFDIAGKVESSGNNIQHLLDYIIGSASVKSTSIGTIRLLDKNTIVGTTTSIAGSALQIAGNLLGNKVKELKGAGDMIEILSKLDYSSAVIEFSRNADTYNYNLDKFNLITKDIILSSEGGLVYYNPLVAFTEQKIDIPVNIYLANDIRTTFTSIGYGETESDIENFYVGPKFQATGTIAKPENNLLEILTKSTVTNPIRSTLKNLFQ